LLPDRVPRFRWQVEPASESEAHDPVAIPVTGAATHAVGAPGHEPGYGGKP